MPVNIKTKLHTAEGVNHLYRLKNTKFMEEVPGIISTIRVADRFIFLQMKKKLWMKKKSGFNGVYTLYLDGMIIYHNIASNIL